MTRRAVAKLLIVGPLVVLVMHYGIELVAVDRCLDSGGVYDYAQTQCRRDVQTLPYVPYTYRHRVLLVVLVAVIVGGVATLVRIRLEPEG